MTTERAILTLSSPAVRERAKRWIDGVPDKTRVTFMGPRRNLDQNARLWSALQDVAKAVPYHGMKLSAEDYKCLFMDALWRETRLLPSLENDGLVTLRRSTSDLSVAECNMLIELVYKWGSEQGVVFSVDERENH